MKRMLKQPNTEVYCIRRIAGLICIIAGIITILSKVIYFMVTNVTVPFDGRGQFLVGTGAALLGITSFDTILSRIGKGNQKEDQ